MTISEQKKLAAAVAELRTDSDSHCGGSTHSFTKFAALLSL
jgi:hypothetical protein